VSETVLKVARDFASEVESMEFPNNIIQFTGTGKP
jgi:3-methyl-2-oxobutanoate hydroxymethyltransferase